MQITEAALVPLGLWLLGNTQPVFTPLKCDSCRWYVKDVQTWGGGGLTLECPLLSAHYIAITAQKSNLLSFKQSTTLTYTD